MIEKITRTSSDPIWLGAFKIRPELVCEACPGIATRRCAWIWKGRVALRLLCEACSEVAGDARSACGRHVSAHGPRPSGDEPVRVETPAAALAFDGLAWRGRTSYG